MPASTSKMAAAVRRASWLGSFGDVTRAVFAEPFFFAEELLLGHLFGHRRGLATTWRMPIPQRPGGRQSSPLTRSQPTEIALPISRR